MKNRTKIHTFAKALTFNKSNDIHKGKAISQNLCFKFFLS